MAPPIAPPTGLYGKLPARGDFLRAGLPRRFTDPLDAWLQKALVASRAALGANWTDAWLGAPVWRFVLPPGVCGPDPAQGVMLPSVDRAGRYFPIVIARLAVPDAGTARFLAAAEQAALAAIAGDHAPDAVLAALAAPVERLATLPVIPGDMTFWWTEGGRCRTASFFAAPGMPDGAQFAAMLDTGAGEP